MGWRSWLLVILFELDLILFNNFDAGGIGNLFKEENIFFESNNGDKYSSFIVPDRAYPLGIVGIIDPVFDILTKRFELKLNNNIKNAKSNTAEDKKFTAEEGNLWEALKIDDAIEDYSFGTYKCVAFIISTGSIDATSQAGTGVVNHYVTYVKTGNIYDDDNNTWKKWDAYNVTPKNQENEKTFELRDIQQIMNIDENNPNKGVAFTPLFLRIKGTQDLPDDIDFNKAYIRGVRLKQETQKEREIMENEFKQIREQIVREHMIKGEKDLETIKNDLMNLFKDHKILYNDHDLNDQVINTWHCYSTESKLSQNGKIRSKRIIRSRCSLQASNKKMESKHGSFHLHGKKWDSYH